MPYYRLLTEAEQRELQGDVQVFVAEKTFEGCGGLEITDEIRVTIAAQARRVQEPVFQVLISEGRTVSVARSEGALEVSQSR